MRKERTEGVQVLISATMHGRDSVVSNIKRAETQPETEEKCMQNN